MLEVRKLPPNRGLAWFLQAVNLGRRHPGTLFGAAALLILTLYAATFLLLLPVTWQTLDAGKDAGFPVQSLVIAFVVLSCLFPVLLGGLMQVLRAVENGQPARPRDIFQTFRSPLLRRLLVLGLVQLGLNVIAALLVGVLAGGAEYWNQYFTVLQGAMSGNIAVAPEPAHPLLMFLAQTVFNYLSGAILLLSLPLILFSDVSLGEAVKLSLRAALRNVVPNFGAAALFLLGVLVAALVVGGVTLVVGGIASLIHASLAVIVVLALYLLFGSVVMLVLAGCALAAWSDTFGEGAVDIPQDPGQFAA